MSLWKCVDAAIPIVFAFGVVGGIALFDQQRQGSNDVNETGKIAAPDQKENKSDHGKMSLRRQRMLDVLEPNPLQSIWIKDNALIILHMFRSTMNLSVIIKIYW